MGEDQPVEQARQLMAGAANAFTTVQGALHVRRDPEAARTAWRRRETFAKFPRHVVTITEEMRVRLPPKYRVVIPDEADGQLWVQHPWTLRTEGGIGWGTQPWGPVAYRVAEIAYRHISWSWDLNDSRFQGPVTHGARPTGPVELFDPRRLLRYWSLRPLGYSTVAGRPTIRVMARPHPDDPDAYGISMLNQFSWIGDAADAWEVDVDHERGLILKLASMVEGAPFLTVQFTSIRFDAPIPEEVFTFADCAGDEEPPLWHHRIDDHITNDRFLP